MCGIAGFFTLSKRRSRDDLLRIGIEMADAIKHRGPDTSGVWASPETGLTLAHRRLSIIDLSANGHQPMHSETERYVTVFNGEIYNHQELRRELLTSGKSFRGHSDTEVLLAGCEAWGVEQTIDRCIGMFAVAVWDTQERHLYLVRDRMGEKPLYYGWQDDTFLFASELKAMRRHPDFGGDIDRDALALYFRHSYIPAPYSIYRGVCKLEAGTILQLSLGATAQRGIRPESTKTRYWSLKDIAEGASGREYEDTPEEAVDTLEALLEESIQGQMIADVPLGAFLSGGIDSSAIVAVMQRLSATPVNTFCIGFAEQGFNEAVYAKQIAGHLGCRHTELYVTPRHAQDVIPRMPLLYDEPFADPSQIPTFLVSQLARRHVTVSLSGDAGDELFGGYTVYPLLFKRWDVARRITIRSAQMRELIARIGRRLCHTDQKQTAVIRALLSSDTYVDLYRAMMSVCPAPCRLVQDSREPPSVLTNRELWPIGASRENAIMALDAMLYLPDDILVKVDRAAMACSLETRIPLLDHRIVEFALTLPWKIKFREGVTKWPLRQILYKHVPRALVERPKKGFAIPLSRWLRQDLKEWACDTLDEKTIREDGLLHLDAVHTYVSDHMNERHDYGRIVWNLLMFQSWLHA